MNDFMPITITNKAMSQFATALGEAEDKPFAVRIGVKGGGCSGFMFNLEFIQESDIDQEDDVTYTTSNIKFVIDILSEQYLKGMTLDYISGLNESGFKFTGGAVTRTCGCGASFSN
jgi:iron-sulfur cluster assembly protein